MIKFMLHQKVEMMKPLFILTWFWSDLQNLNTYLHNQTKLWNVQAVIYAIASSSVFYQSELRCCHINIDITCLGSKLIEIDVTPKSFTNDSEGLKNLKILQAKIYASLLRSVFA